MLCYVRSVETSHYVSAVADYWLPAKIPILRVRFVIVQLGIGNAVGVQEQPDIYQHEVSIDSMKRLVERFPIRRFSYRVLQIFWKK